ncbi:MAG: hypothetical protein QM500_09880 [Methylococcales bacterium]
MEHLTIIIIALIFMNSCSLISAKIDGYILTPPLIFSVLGLLLSQNSLALVDIHIDHHAIYIMAEITLVLVLFSDAARIDLRGLKTDHSLPVRMLLLGLP